MLPEIGHGIAGASAASSPKGGNRTSKMAHEMYATPRVVASENACVFQNSVMTHLAKDSWFHKRRDYMPGFIVTIAISFELPPK